MSSSATPNQKKPLLPVRDSPPPGSREGVEGNVQDKEKPVPVSSLTKTPWGDIMPRRASQNSIPTPPSSKLKPELSIITKSSSDVAQPSRGAKTSPGPKPAPPPYKPANSQPQLNAPGPKPKLPGPKSPGLKPAFPGPKPKLPGPKPKLPGPKPILSGPKPKLPLKPKTCPEQQISQKGQSPEVSPSHAKAKGKSPELSPSHTKAKGHSPILPPSHAKAKGKSPELSPSRTKAKGHSPELPSNYTKSKKQSPEGSPSPTMAKGQSPEVSPGGTNSGLVSSDEWVVIDSLVDSPRFPRTKPSVEKTTVFPFPDPNKQVNGEVRGRHRSPSGSPVLGRAASSTPPGSPRRKPPALPGVPSSPSPLSTASSAKGASPTLVAKLADIFEQPSLSTHRTAPSTASTCSDARASTLPRLTQNKTGLSSPSAPVDESKMLPAKGQSQLSPLGKASTTETRPQSLPSGASFDQVFNEQKDMKSLEVQRMSLNMSTDSSDESPENSPAGSTTDVAAAGDHLHLILTDQRQSLPAADEPVDTAPAKPELTPEELAEKHRNKRYNIAKELRDTEEKYVSRLKLVAEDFYEAISAVNTEKKTVVPDSAFHQIFLNIIPIYQFNKELLSQLQGMLESWSESESLGEVLSRLAPFLKLYSQYTSKFHSAMETLTAWAKKEKKFDAALKQFEQSPTCGGLSVAHHMLEPVQRIPRYRLLLADYLKYLPEDSPDYKPAEKALAVISEAADAANNRIKDLERLSELLAIQRALQDYDEPLVAPGRTLIKKGRLNKFSRKTTQQRAFFLFSDMLIHATISSAGGYKCRDVMPILGMEVSTPTLSPIPHTFTVVSTTRSLTLAANTEDEKQEWYEAVQKVIRESKDKLKSLRRDDSLNVKDTQDTGFGVKAPVWLPDDSVSMCMICCAEFKLTFRRHHCRACGKVICNNCFKYKVYLRYKGKQDKVCDGCFQEARKQGLVDECIDEHEEATDGDTAQPGRTALDVKAVDQDTVIGNYLLVLHEGKKNFARFWFQLKKDCVLYRFKAHEDVRAIESIPLPGYDIQKEGSNTLILTRKISVHTPGVDALKRETHRLKVEEGDVDMWMDLLVKASCFELTEASS